MGADVRGGLGLVLLALVAWFCAAGPAAASDPCPLLRADQASPDVATRIVENHRGQGWQALSVVITYDRREVLPSYAAFEWAPEGRWADAATGDAASGRATGSTRPSSATS